MNVSEELIREIVQKVLAEAKQQESGEDFVKENIAEYEYSGIINHSELSNNVKGGLLVKRKKIKRIKDFIIGNVRKYS